MNRKVLFWPLAAVLLTACENLRLPNFRAVNAKKSSLLLCWVACQDLLVRPLAQEIKSQQS
jgi:hypothetical protein